MLIDSLLHPIASILNRGIDDNDDAQDLCDALDGRSLRIAAQPLGKSVLLTATDGMITLSTDTQLIASAEIAGNLIALNRIFFVDRLAPLDESQAEVSGDADIANQFRKLLLCARPDLEEVLAGWLGNSLASHITDFATGTRDWAADVAEDLTERTSDFLQEDAGQLPTSQEVDAHLKNVDELASAVQNMENRLTRLTEQSPA